MNGDVLTVSFADCPCQVTAKVEIRPRYFTLTVTGVSGGELDWLQLCNLRVKMNENVGGLVNAAWDGQFAACVLACNDRTDCGSHGVPTARAYREFGIVGAKVAIVGVPTGGPEPSSKLLDAIEVVELEQGLPHPTINGVWIKRAPERFASYLMVGGVNQQNIDQVIEFARGGFGCIEIFWERSTPSYEPNPAQFPDGLAGLKAVADKVHAAGTAARHARDAGDGRLGLQGRSLHHAQGRSPLAPGPPRDAGRCAGHEQHGDPRARSRPPAGRRKATCTSRARSSATRSSPRTDLPSASAACTRPRSSRIAEGAPVGHLVNCFPIWGHTVYCPDVKSTMIDEICDRIARVFNEVGADMSYFDGGEEIAVQPPHWRNQGRIALGVQSRLRKPVILEGNALYTHLSWHVISRGSPSYDPIYFGRRAYTLRFKGQNPAGWANNLLTGDVGWFAPHTHSLATDAVTPDEVELLCLKALGGKSPISFSVDANNLSANKRMPEMREIIRTCDELKRRNYFTEAACAELRRPMAEHVAGACGGRRLGPAAAAVRPAARGRRSSARTVRVDVCESAPGAIALAPHPRPDGPGAARSERQSGAGRPGGRHSVPASRLSGGRTGAKRGALGREVARRGQRVLLSSRESGPVARRPGARLR